MRGRAALILAACGLGVALPSRALGAERFVYEPGILRDPMRPLVDAQGNPMSYSERTPASTLDISALRLEGILWDFQDPVAIVNGELLRQGETIFGIRVVEIHEEYIVVESEGNVRTIFLFPETSGAQ